MGRWEMANGTEDMGGVSSEEPLVPLMPLMPLWASIILASITTYSYLVVNGTRNGSDQFPGQASQKVCVWWPT